MPRSAGPDATTLPEIIQEMLLTKTSERQGRLIDHDQAGSMEEKKKVIFLHASVFMQQYNLFEQWRGNLDIQRY